MRFAYLPLSIWVGAMGCAIVAAFRVFGMLEDDKVAGDIMAGIFRAVDSFGLLASLLAAAVSFASTRRFVLACGLAVGVAANIFWIAPKIAVEGGRGGWHRASESLWAALLLGAVILALMGPPRAKSHAK